MRKEEEEMGKREAKNLQNIFFLFAISPFPLLRLAVSPFRLLPYGTGEVDSYDWLRGGIPCAPYLLC